MKKFFFYIADDEVDLGNLIKTLWKEKILILSINVVLGLLENVNFYMLMMWQEQQFM
jgi:LPS O-antigen subunit length determinant protein (WzzB/FepE family)